MAKRPRYADPALPMETRIVAAELAIAQVAERAEAVRDVLRELVASAVESDRAERLLETRDPAKWLVS
jgi:predicted trehalose synthase